MCSVLLSLDPPDRADMMESGGGELLPGPALPVTSKPGDGRGGWRAALFIVAMGFFERIGFVGVSANLIMYLTGPLGMSTAAAAAGVNAWSGTVNACPRLPLVGALVADSRLGRYRAVLAACVLYLLEGRGAPTEDIY
ncbi:protein NRT1/ PTR FAMILY 5.10-like isoform X2 [Miscanthus floridulus]|uniref:protein NRT1/ PTR FAMILY 5.10-like isoform X2 n=1 Tax=Miscanthus floridulus TaxID=154761 RepID=UPI00345B02BA